MNVKTVLLNNKHEIVDTLYYIYYEYIYIYSKICMYYIVNINKIRVV